MSPFCRKKDAAFITRAAVFYLFPWSSVQVGSNFTDSKDVRLLFAFCVVWVRSFATCRSLMQRIPAVRLCVCVCVFVTVCELETSRMRWLF
jgi:hypothetical protein